MNVTIRNNGLTNAVRKYYYDYKNRAYRSFNNVHAIKPGGVILVSHDAEKQGAQTLLLYITKWYYEHGIPVVLLSRRIGPLIAEFMKYAHTEVMDTKQMKAYITMLHQDYHYGQVLLNTIVCGDLAPIFQSCGYHVICTIHELDQTILRLNLVKRLKTVNEHADCVIFPSSYVKQRIERNIMPLSCPTICKAQGLFLTKSFAFDPTAARNTLESKYPNRIRKDTLIVLGVGFACYRKGTDLFMEMAFEAYRKKEPIQFIWIGDHTDKMYHAVLKKHRLKSLPNLLFPGYIDDPKELHQYYQGCDVFALTSREEPFASVVLEAYHACKPILAFQDSGGVCDLVIQDKSGYLAKPYDVQDMFHQVLRLKDTTIRKRMGEAGNAAVQTLSFDRYCAFLYETMKSLKE